MFDKNNVVLEMVDKKPDNGFEYAWGALTFNRKLEQYINNQDPHIGYAVKESVNKGEKVSVSLIEEITLIAELLKSTLNYSRKLY